ncbi:hypothetical protein IAQ61_008973 [Plenodomus lingam]|uniref:Short chain dehydrogenase/reductase n=1 Tax=Leptosphaeria maculans (strain JN3 / isolate v23.1.3 / race Av1-4-5-6-7-8) TaxID=985895 RepID=E4ZNP1_LEPMJ|nr:hypothetical protein LEMA_P041610.1 [Plenodomus lingam JN3]KAH9865027.1 hypothetical protein IAQ61_008973 [Plenodomus lingam]CBX93260.1 hypothetical protein LEMA_P041610.1 [Plenodomus lingam JN3]
MAMLLSGSNVTLTRVSSAVRRDVRTLAMTGARYNSRICNADKKDKDKICLTSSDCSAGPIRVRPSRSSPWQDYHYRARPTVVRSEAREYTTGNMATNNSELELGKVFNVKGKVALVTGGGSGIGLMITQTLAVNGARVYIVGRTEEKLDKVVAVHGKGIPGQIIAMVGDVSTKDGVDRLVEEMESKEKYLDILVNNAGIAPDKGETSVDSAEQLKKEFYDRTTEKEWLDVYQTNVVAPFLMSMAFLPLVNKSTEANKGYSGTIVNISSLSGHIRISQGHFAYNSSKGAAIHLNRMLAAEIAKCGVKVRVNSIAPGVFPSEMTTNDSRDDNQKSEMAKEHKEGLPAQRPGKDQDMAAAILFVVGCQYLNGQTVTVDGGYAIQVGN